MAAQAFRVAGTAALRNPRPFEAGRCSGLQTPAILPNPTAIQQRTMAASHVVGPDSYRERLVNPHTKIFDVGVNRFGMAHPLASVFFRLAQFVVELVDFPLINRQPIVS